MEQTDVKTAREVPSDEEAERESSSDVDAGAEADSKVESTSTLNDEVKAPVNKRKVCFSLIFILVNFNSTKIRSLMFYRN
jgi:hypothetical protein